ARAPAPAATLSPVTSGALMAPATQSPVSPRWVETLPCMALRCATIWLETGGAAFSSADWPASRPAPTSPVITATTTRYHLCRIRRPPSTAALSYARCGPALKPFPIKEMRHYEGPIRGGFPPPVVVFSQCRSRFTFHFLPHGGKPIPQRVPRQSQQARRLALVSVGAPQRV